MTKLFALALSSITLLATLAACGGTSPSEGTVNATEGDQALSELRGKVACTHAGSGQNRSDHCTTTIACDPHAATDTCGASYGKSWRVPVSAEGRCIDRHDFLSVCLGCSARGTCEFDNAQ